MNLDLNYEGFEEFLVERYPDMDGVHYVFRFANDYGASVIKVSGSYGYRNDQWELGVVIFDEDGQYELTYDTPITKDVIGYLTDEDVRDLLGRIKEL